MIIKEIVAHKKSFAKTALLYASFMGLGLHMGMPGPAMLDLRQAAQATAQEITWIFPIGSAGYLTGSVITGLLFDRFNPQIFMATFSLLLAVAAVIFPWNRQLWSLSLTNFLAQTGGGAMDSGGNAWLLHLWGASAAPFMQALHFFYGIGTFLGPLIAVPFLTKLPPNTTDDNLDEVLHELGTDGLMIQWPFGFIGVFIVAVAVGFLVMFVVQRVDKKHPSREEDNRKALTTKSKIILLTLAALFFHFYCGLEIAFGRYLTSFAFNCDLHLDKSVGAYMTSVFWGTFTFFRLGPVFAVQYISSSLLLALDLAVVLFANILLIPFANSSELVLWIGTALMGIGTASIFATMYAFMEEYIQVTSKMSALFLVAASTGEFTIPFLVGYFIDTYPMSMVYVILISSCSCVVFFAIIHFYGKRLQSGTSAKIEISLSHSIILNNNSDNKSDSSNDSLNNNKGEVVSTIK